jgi:ATP-dependent Lon protease
MEIVSTIKDLVNANPLHKEQLKLFIQFGGDFENSSRLADVGASLTTADGDRLQNVLEALDVPHRWV